MKYNQTIKYQLLRNFSIILPKTIYFIIKTVPKFSNAIPKKLNQPKYK